MMKHLAMGLMAFATLAASPASAATVIDTTTATPASTTGPQTFSAGGITATATGFSYTVAPTSLTSTALNAATPQLTAGARLVSGANGIGVCSESSTTLPANTATSGECPQVDTHGATNEAIKFSFNTPVYLQSLMLNIVDADDTLRLYGLDTTDNMTFLGFAGTIANGSSFFNSAFQGGTSYLLTFTPILGAFSGYLFTSNNNSDDGYRIRSLTVSAVPELEIWAMLILGFGLIGVQQRRRRRLPVVAA